MNGPTMQVKVKQMYKTDNDTVPIHAVRYSEAARFCGCWSKHTDAFIASGEGPDHPTSPREYLCTRPITYTIVQDMRLFMVGT